MKKQVFITTAVCLILNVFFTFTNVSASQSTVTTYSKSSSGNTYLSTNFKVSEFACKDGSDTVKIDSELVVILQKIRDHFGKAIVINSGYRTSSYNAQVGGASNSYHVKGMAADISVSGVTPSEVAKYAETIGVRGVGRYNTFVHVDTRPTKYYWTNSGNGNVTASTHGGNYNSDPYGVPEYEPQGQDPIGRLEACYAGIGSIRVAGWALDEDIPSESIGLHVYIGGPVGSPNIEGYQIAGNIFREDINDVYGTAYHGFDETINTNKTGEQDVYVYAINVGGGNNILLGVATVDITPIRNPIGNFEACYGGMGTISVAGWALDEDVPSENIVLDVYIGGAEDSANAEKHQIIADIFREDINNVYGTGHHGFYATLNTKKTGKQEVYIYAENVGSGKNMLLGSKTVDIKPTVPLTATAVTKNTNYNIFDVTVENADGGTVILALYNGNQLVDVQTEEYKGENVVFSSSENYTTAKIMLWDSLSAMKPLSQVEIK